MSEPARDDWTDSEPPSSGRNAPPAKADDARRAPPAPSWPHRHRALTGVGIAVAALLLVVSVASFFLDGTLRRTLESRMNRHLHGYRVTLGGAHLRLATLRLTLRDLVIRQQADPEPPVAAIPRLRMGIEWNQLVRGHLVGDVRFQQPHLHLDLPQLRGEVSDPVKLQDRGWQQALESLYPLKFNHFEVDDGDVVYVDEDAAHPLHLSHFQLSAENIRNIQSRDRTYPSPVHAEAVVFDSGRATLDGNADFLAAPLPGIHAVYHAANVPLARLKPIAQRGNVVIRAGELSSHGEIEYAPKVKIAHVADVTIAGLDLDYLHTTATATAEKKRGEKVAVAARRAAAEPGLDLQVDRLAVTGGALGFVDRARDPGYRVHLDRAEVSVEHLSNARGPALVKVTGRFMGSGAARATARFREAAKGPELTLDAAIENASLPAINHLLRSYLKFDVAAGTFSVYSQTRIHDGRIQGYVKPLFQNVKVYDPRQDEDKSLGQKIKEKLANVAAKVLTNRQHHDVATVADISGPVNGPHASVWEITWKAIENAFVKAILPGFERQYAPHHAKR